MKVIGVTGTKGKTTVAWMLKKVLEAGGIPDRHYGNYWGRYGEAANIYR